MPKPRFKKKTAYLKPLPKLTTKWLMLPYPQNYDSKKHIPDFFFKLTCPTLVQKNQKKLNMKIHMR